MEPDRYQQNHQLYIFGMICFVFSLGVMLFFFFTLPHLLFAWRYDVPEFIAFWREFLVFDFGFTEKQASVLISLLFLMIGLLFGYGAYYASTRLDNQIYGIDDKPTSGRKKWITPELKESLYVFMKVLGLIMLFFATILLFQWLIYIPPTIP